MSGITRDPTHWFEQLKARLLKELDTPTWFRASDISDPLEPPVAVENALYELVGQGKIERLDSDGNMYFRCVRPAKRPIPRASWDEYFMRIAEVVASRATCDRKHVGAVVVRDKSILATGKED